MEPHEATEWLRKRIAWAHWLTELHHNLQAEAELDVQSLAEQRQRRLPALLSSDWWNRRSA
jgi:hypothetical protein